DATIVVRGEGDAHPVVPDVDVRVVVRGLGVDGEPVDERDGLGEGAELEALHDLVAHAVPVGQRREALGDQVVGEGWHGSGGGTRTHNNSVNSRALCRLSYPGMASDDSSALVRPMMRRWVSLHESVTYTHPNSCFAVRIDGSATARYGARNCDRGRS